MKLSKNIEFAPKQAAVLHSKARYVLSGGQRGGGKGLPLRTRVVTPFGYRRIGDLRVGDTITARDGSPTKVIGVYPQGKRPVFRLTFADGAQVIADDQHLWSYNLGHGRWFKSKKNWKVATTPQLKTLLDSGKKVHIPLCDPVKFTRSAGRPIDPYLLGLLLGDGCFRGGSPTLTTRDQEIANWLPDSGVEFVQDNGVTWRARGESGVDLKHQLQRLGLWGRMAHEKHLPERYKFAPVADRLAVLRGLMDSDGYIDSRGQAYFTSTSRQLAEDVRWLVFSLGGRASITEKHPTYTYDGEQLEGRDAFEVYIRFSDNGVCVQLTRKRERATKFMHETLRRSLVSIEALDEPEETVCIAVDDTERLFMVEDFIVTHNSFTLVGDAAGLCNTAGPPAIDIPGYRALIIRKTFPELRHIIQLADQIFKMLRPGVQFSSSSKEFHFPSGAVVEMGYMEREDQWKQYQGREFQFIGWEELTEHPWKDAFHNVNTSLRMSDALPLDALKIRATCNPGGVGHQWVKEFWQVSGRPTEPFGFDITHTETDPQTGAPIPVTLRREFHPFGIDDNPHLQDRASYKASLRSTLSDQLVAAHLEGDWDVVDIKGSVYRDEMLWLHEHNRIADWPWDPRFPVNTFWDVGNSDYTSVWFHQLIEGTHRFIDFFQFNRKPVNFFAKTLRERPYTYGVHFMPHDVDQKFQRAADIASLRDIYEDAGVRPIVVVPRIPELMAGVEMTRMFFRKCYFNEAACEEGITCLQNYRHKWEEGKNMWSAKPIHDVNSHAADAFRQAAQAEAGGLLEEDYTRASEEAEEEALRRRIERGEVDPRIMRGQRQKKREKHPHWVI